MSNMLDEDNIEFIAERQVLHNRTEILQNIRKRGNFYTATKLIGSILYMLLVFLFVVTVFGFILQDLAALSKNLLISIVILFLLLFLFASMLKSTISNLKWFSGISDEKIIDNLISQGVVKEGIVTSVSDNTIFFRLGKYSSSFDTVSSEKYQVGDKLVILHVPGIVAVIL